MLHKLIAQYKFFAKFFVFGIGLLLLFIVIFQTHFINVNYPKSLDTHLQTISSEIHPVGSVANRNIGEYILNQIPQNYEISTQEF
jgi:hypothetical protein